MDQSVTTGSWCIELWDQSEGLLKTNTDLNTQSETYYKFMKDITAMHMDIAKKYKKTVNTYMPKKKPGEEDSSLVIAFHEMLNSFNSMALIHEKLSKDISDTILLEYKKFYDESVKSNQKQAKSRVNIYKHLDEGKKKIEGSWTSYLASYRTKNKAHEANMKAQADDALSRADQSRFETNYRLKEKEYCDRELTYATDLKKFNDHRFKYYSGTLLNMITIVEEQEGLRSVLTAKIIEELAQKHKSTFEELAEITAATNDSAKKIDYERDLRLTTNKMKTNDLFPVDLPFLSLQRCPPNYLEGLVTQLYNYMVGLEEVVEKPHKGGSFTMSLFKKSPKGETVNISSPFVNGLGIKNVKLNELTVLQVHMKISEFNRILDSTEKEIDASEKMINLYQSDPNLGDAETIKPRFQILQRKLFSIKNLLAQFEERYQSLGGDSARIKMEQKLDSTYSQEDTKNTSRVESDIYEFDSDEGPDTGIDSNSNCSHPENTPNVPLPPPPSTIPAHVAIGTAMYDYPGDGPLYLPCQMNERFYVVEKDTSNSGWTEVVTLQGKNGYVPSQYLQIEDV